MQFVLREQADLLFLVLDSFLQIVEGVVRGLLWPERVGFLYDGVKHVCVGVSRVRAERRVGRGGSFWSE